jgi:dipeptidyl aminopeptidase/acylaminoacyl peptidase/uncharacterized Zn finger protein (UPF0148 family)
MADQVCPECGTTAPDDGQRFCGQCGTRLGSAEAQASDKQGRRIRKRPQQQQERGRTKAEEVAPGKKPRNAAKRQRRFKFDAINIAIISLTVAALLTLFFVFQDSGDSATPATTTAAPVTTTAAPATTTQPPTTTAAPETTTSTLFPTITEPPSEVQVLVANGSGTARAGGLVAELLVSKGYVTLPPANAQPTDSTMIFFRPGMVAEARAVMEILAPDSPDLLAQIPPTGLAVAENAFDRLEAADIVVILGADGRIHNGTPATTALSPTTAQTRSTANLIAFDSVVPAGASAGNGNWEVFVMNPDGTQVRQLTDNDNDDRCGSWSPDGSRIAFASDRDGGDEIFVMNADGTEVRQLTDNDSWDHWPAWSPDGSRIAFVSDRDGGPEVFVMNADGTGVYSTGVMGFGMSWGG